MNKTLNLKLPFLFFLIFFLLSMTACKCQVKNEQELSELLIKIENKEDTTSLNYRHQQALDDYQSLLLQA